MLEAAFTMLSMDGSTSFHSLVFSPQSGLQHIDMSILAAQKLAAGSKHCCNTPRVHCTPLHTALECGHMLPRNPPKYVSSLAGRYLLVFGCKEWGGEAGGAHLTQIRSVRPFKMLLSRKDLIFSDMNSTLHQSFPVSTVTNLISLDLRWPPPASRKSRGHHLQACQKT